MMERFVNEHDEFRQWERSSDTALLRAELQQRQRSSSSSG